jgi:hypothetical protein
MITRRQFLSRSSLALVGLGASAYAVQGPNPEGLPDGSATRDMITPAAQQAINLGLDYLRKHQSADGSFGGNHQYAGNVAITSLGALAMMAGGYLPGRGMYGDVVARALRYVLDQDDGRGYLLSRSGVGHGPMYGQGFGTLFLAEVYGMVNDPELRDKLRTTLKRAVNLIVKCQNDAGGWRYLPGDGQADISVTICQIMALRAARNAGLSVPKSTVDRCVSYVKRCQCRDGGFCYQLHQPEASQFARSAAGLVALNCAGIYKGTEVERALHYLQQFRPGRGIPRPEVNLHYYYGHYYAAQAMWTAGGNYWADWFPAIRDELVSHPDRRALGSWSDARFSDHYATAMACIILQIPNNYLPILQK